MRVVELLGRPGCHLCDEAREQIERVRGRAPFLLREVDIESDDRLFATHLERIPVVRIDGVEVFTLFVDEAELERRLAEPEARVE